MLTEFVIHNYFKVSIEKWTMHNNADVSVEIALLK